MLLVLTLPDVLLKHGVSRQPVGQLVLWSVMPKLTTRLQPPSPPHVYTVSGILGLVLVVVYLVLAVVYIWIQMSMVYHLILNICTALSQ